MNLKGALQAQKISMDMQMSELINDGQFLILPIFLKKYQSRINIEYCHTVTLVKYLFLYHFKEKDMITISEVQPLNEIEHFQTHPYLSSCYCYWRTAEFDMVQIKPPVITLPVHLENQQNVVYEA